MEKNSNPELFSQKLRSNNLKKKYGITLDKFEEMYKNQGGVCAICKCVPHIGRLVISRGFCVDHDHLTEQVRALVCFNCNTMIGLAKDNPDILRAGADYIEFHKKQYTEIIEFPKQEGGSNEQVG